MRCYVVTFEVASPAIRQKLHDRLKTYRTRCPIHKHCWAIVTDQTAREIRDYLKQVLLPRDRLFVVRSGTEAAWRGSYGPTHDDWLKKYL